MTDLQKKVLRMSLIGFAAGVGIGVVFYFLNDPNDFLSQTENRFSLLLYFLFSGLYGGINMGTSAVYGIEEWSILRCTATHFAICVGSSIAFFGGMILLGWMGMPPLGVCLIMLAAFLAAYFLIWFLQYLSYHRKVKHMNAKLRAWKAHRPK